MKNRAFLNTTMKVNRNNGGEDEYSDQDIEALKEELKQLRLFKKDQEAKEKFGQHLTEIKALLTRKPGQAVEVWADGWMAKLVPRIQGVQAAMYIVTDNNTNRLEYISGFAISARSRQTLASSQNALLQHVVKTKEPYEVPLLANPPVLQAAAHIQLVPKTLLIHPFTYQNEVLGVVEVYLLEALTEQQRALIADLQDSVALSLKMYRDKTSLKASLHEMQQTKDRHQNILDNTQQALALLDQQGQILDANKAFFQLLDYSGKSEALPSFFKHLADEADHKHLQLVINKLMQTEHNSQITLLRLASEYGGRVKYKFHFTKIAVPHQSDSILVQLLGYSIINKKHQHTELSFEVLNDAMQEVFIFDMHNLEVLYANKSALTNIEFSLKGLKGQRFDELLPQFNQDALVEIIKVLSQSNKEYIQFEAQLRRQDQSLYAANLRLIITSYRTKPVVVAMVQDISQRKELERDLLLQGDKIAKELTRKVNEKEKKLEWEKARTQEINQQIIQQNKIIADKRKNMLDSLQYAKMIQESILPSEATMRKHVIESFVYYKAKDVVSGDFYWVHEKQGKVFLVAADCTGHGVPGALLTMLGSNLLKEVVKTSDTDDPADILEQLDKVMSESLQHEEVENRDGMDVALCVIDKQKQRISFAGAKNPLIYIKDNEVQKIRGSIRSIGSWAHNLPPFVTHHIAIDQPSTFYIFSDGYQDQFGGEADKKFMVSQLKSLFKQIHLKPMAEQKQFVIDTMDAWIGRRSQTDDMLVMGFKLSNDIA